MGTDVGYFQKILLRLLKTMVYTYWTLLPAKFLSNSFTKSSYLILTTNQLKECGILARWSPNLLPSPLSTVRLLSQPPLKLDVAVWMNSRQWNIEENMRHTLGLAHINLPKFLRSHFLYQMSDCRDLQSRRQSYKMGGTWVAESLTEQDATLSIHAVNLCEQEINFCLESLIFWGCLLQQLDYTKSTF